ncbi:MAG: DUF1304 domain-containing protein [Reinekea sp.]
MHYLAMALVLLVAVEHIYILVLEMFLWTKPKGRKVFGLEEEFANSTRAMAANQGLYNGFLAAGLIWGLIHPVAYVGMQIQLFFLCCVLTAAIYGSITANKSILFSQGAPALIALAGVLLFY